MLTIIVFLPLVAAVIIALFLKERRTIWTFAAAVTLVDLLLSLAVFALYDRGGERFQFVDGPLSWIPALDVQYLLGVDGVSAPLVFLTGLLGFVAVMASRNIDLRPREYFAWLLVLQTSVFGVFASLDLVLFLIFWELELAPMYFLIAQWGTGRKEYSALKFLVFTFFGSAFMLVAIVALYLSTGTFDLRELLAADIEGAALVLPAAVMWWFFLIAFGIKLPTVPVHTWLPDAHTDAPTAVSVLLAGVLLKMGGYGLIRFNMALFPDQSQNFAVVLAALGLVATFLYGAVITIRQSDLKRLVAYSSVSHMGIVLLGLAAVGGRLDTPSMVGLTGAALQLFTHGAITGLLFLVVGQIYDRTHTRHIPDLRGLASQIPFIATVFMIAGLASLGLPGLAGFPSELMVFLGSFSQHPWFGGLAVLTTVLTAGYILFMTQRVLFGPRSERWASLRDAPPVEMLAPALLVAVIVLVGVYPAVVTDVFEAELVPVANLFG